MKLSVAVAAMMMMATPVYAQGADDIPGRKAGQPTSDRTPQDKTITPLDQTTQTKQGATSDRTPSNNQMDGASGSSMQHGGQSMQQSSSDQQSGGPNTGRPAVLTPTKLRDSLEKAGFEDIRILDAAYLVHARNSDGDLIVMTINPPTIAAATSAGGTSSSGSSGDSSSEGMGYNAPGSSDKSKP
ncbi:MAG: hypothetical protein K2Q28_13960 [Hyphomicrobium sp.]|nr:hypothetical protein [Hyphomicrobium sp.]